MGSGACVLRMLDRALAGPLVTISVIGGVSTCYLSIPTSAHTLLQFLPATALATTIYPQHATNPAFFNGGTPSFSTPKLTNVVMRRAF
jgi:hypothetical protein